MSVAAREIRPRRAEVRHAQGIADEHRVSDLVADAGRCVAMRMEHLGIEAADVEVLASPEQVVEVAVAGLEIGCVDTGPKMRCTSLICSPMPIFAPVLAFT